MLFFEEPMTGASHPWLGHKETAQGVLVLRPHVTRTAPGFHDEHVQVLRQMLSEAMQDSALHDYLLWFYPPMALPPGLSCNR